MWIEKPSINLYSDPRLWNCAHHFGTYFLEFSAAHHLVLCATPLHHFVHAQIPQPFYQNPLVPILLLPFIANPPSKKHRRENERQKWRRAKSLRGEGPIKREPFPSKECAQRWRKMKEVKKKRKRKKKRRSILSKDRFFSYSERKANREAGWGLDWRRERIEGGGQVVSNTKADERSLLAE